MRHDSDLKKDPLYEEVVRYATVYRKEIFQAYKDNLNKIDRIAQLE